ncbi:MAG TPA: DinB family protein [Candidatus Limnocylindria bacterium]
MESLVRATVDLSDDEMSSPWRWGDYTDEGLRFALLMTHHELRDLAVRLAALRPGRTQAQAILAQYHDAYRDMTAVLAPVRDDDLDRVPAPGEWCLREVLEHLLGADHGFLAVNRFALTRHRAGTYETQTEEDWNAFRPSYAMPKDAVGGGVAAVRSSFARQHERVLRELDDVTDGELELPAEFWEETAMPIRFRLHRFEEHLRQHTVQLEKTLVGIGRAPTEAHRLIRNVYGALAAVESEPAPAPELRDEEAAVLVARTEEIRAR